MSQLSISPIFAAFWQMDDAANDAPIDYIVEHILPNYSDDELSGMLATRTNKDSLLYRAILEEMGNRCAICAELSPA